MLAFFFALQIVLLVYQQINMQIPASSSFLINTVNGVLTLSSVDKKALSQKLHLAADGLVDTLDGLSLIGIFGGLLVLCLLVIIRFIRHPRLQCLVAKIKRIIMWNFSIRYFQVTFLNLLFQVSKQLIGSTFSIKSTLPALSILVFQMTVLATFCYVLIKWPLQMLGQESTKAQIKNLYLGLNTRHRSNVLFGLTFYFSRILVIAILV